MKAGACAVCGDRVARYVCQECGREVCQFCFEPNGWVCSDCYSRLKGESLTSETFRWSAPFKLFLLGFVLMFVGAIVIMVATVLSGGSTGGGVVIWVFPFPPIGFGTGPYAFWFVLLGVALTVVGLVLVVVLRRRR